MNLLKTNMDLERFFHKNSFPIKVIWVPTPSSECKDGRF